MRRSKKTKWKTPRKTAKVSDVDSYKDTWRNNELTLFRTLVSDLLYICHISCRYQLNKLLC